MTYLLTDNLKARDASASKNFLAEKGGTPTLPLSGRRPAKKLAEKKLMEKGGLPPCPLSGIFSVTGVFERFPYDSEEHHQKSSQQMVYFQF